LWRDLHRSFGSFKALHLSVHLTMAALFNGLTRAEFLQELFASCPNANLHAARNAASIEARNEYARRIIGTGTMGFRDLESMEARADKTGAVYNADVMVAGNCVIPVYKKYRGNRAQRSTYFMVGRLTGDCLWFMRMYAEFLSQFMQDTGAPSRQLLLAHFREFWTAFQQWFRTTIPCPSWAP
jgi:hypothetical protein